MTMFLLKRDVSMPRKHTVINSSGSKSEMENEALSQYVTTKQAAEMLGTADANIRHALIEGRVQGRKLGHYWLVYLPSLKEYFETKSPAGRPPAKEPKIQLAS
jgi:hypothetical protein